MVAENFSSESNRDAAVNSPLVTASGLKVTALSCTSFPNKAVGISQQALYIQYATVARIELGGVFSKVEFRYWSVSDETLEVSLFDVGGAPLQKTALSAAKPGNNARFTYPNPSGAPIGYLEISVIASSSPWKGYACFDDFSWSV